MIYGLTVFFWFFHFVAKHSCVGKSDHPLFDMSSICDDRKYIYLYYFFFFGKNDVVEYRVVIRVFKTNYITESYTIKDVRHLNPSCYFIYV